MATSPYATSVVDVEDEENRIAWAKPKLTPETEHYLVMSESAFRKHSEKGGNGEQTSRKPTKHVDFQQRTNDEDKKMYRTKQLFDKPQIPPRPEWIKDPRLPDELNDIMSTMWTRRQQNQSQLGIETKSRMYSSTNEEYREAKSDEESEPIEFHSYLRVRRPILKKPTRVRLPTVDESLHAIRREFLT